MNAQEALNEIVAQLSAYYRNTSEDRAIMALQQLIDQSNAKPKTLEELGWELTYDGGEYVSYFRRKGSKRIVFWADKKNVRLISHALS